ncbi:MAG: hypothetical protein ACO3EP_04610 [Phycisphaerales bacterium]|jgi:hypothetical protein
MNAPAATAARRMNLYAMVLIVLGLIGYGLAWSEANAPPAPTPAQAESEAAVEGAVDTAPAAAPSLTPLIFTVGPAMLMLLMGFMSSRIERSKIVGMIGIHLGMLLPIVFAIAYAVVGWGRYTKWQAGEKPFANVLLFAVMVLSSVVAAVLVLKARPSKDARSA